MSETMALLKLRDGTLIRHKVSGYKGRIDGTTEIQACFTAGGELLGKPSTKQTFQYRVAVKGESMRRIAPVEDLEILEGVVEVICPGCHTTFQSKPGLVNKPRGRCECGGWVCPSCLACRNTNGETAQREQSSCLKERKRLARKLTLQKKARMS